MKYGAIDIGTNAARLLVGEVCADGAHHYVKKYHTPAFLSDLVTTFLKMAKFQK